jgi:outer membrane protein assembly factor BamB
LANPRTVRNLRVRATALLAQRRNGAEYMLSALEHEYDFLNDVLHAPPVGALADALAAMKERSAAPLLARHLNDPANSPNDIERSAAALVALASEAELSELKTFFALYRATADEDALLDAVLHVAEALLKLGGGEGHKLVEMAALDPLTHPLLKKKLALLVRAPTQKSPSG